jgi:hypothetical protein
MLESVHQEDLTPEVDKLNKEKLSLLAEIPKLLHMLAKHKFPEAEAKPAAELTDDKLLYEDIQAILVS